MTQHKYVVLLKLLSNDSGQYRLIEGNKVLICLLPRFLSSLELLENFDQSADIIVMNLGHWKVDKTESVISLVCDLVD